MQLVTTLTSEAIDSFRNSLSAKGRSENTVRSYCADLNTLLSDLQVSMIPMEQFEDQAQRWLNQYRRIKSPKTTGRRLTSLRAFVKWANWPANILADYTPPTPPKSQPHPIPEGIDGLRRMVAVARSPQQRALISLCGFVGMRVGEALTTCPTNFDLNDMLVTIRGKGDKSRIVPVSAEAWDYMADAVAQAFCEATDPPVIRLRDRNARSLITNLGRKAGLRRHISSHDLRATFATEVYNRTLNIRLVQELLGHSSVETTQVYTGVEIGRMREAVVF